MTRTSQSSEELDTQYFLSNKLVSTFARSPAGGFRTDVRNSYCLRLADDFCHSSKLDQCKFGIPWHGIGNIGDLPQLPSKR